MITNYAELQAAVASEANRNDLASSIPMHIAQAEKDLERMLTGSWLLQKSAQLPLLVGATEIVLPADLQRLESASFTNGCELRITTQKERIEQHDKSSDYASIVGKKLILQKALGAASSVDLVYRAKITPLSSLVATNDVLVELWDAYLYASVSHLKRFVADANASQMYMSRAAQSVADFMSINLYSGVGNYYAGGDVA